MVTSMTRIQQRAAAEWVARAVLAYYATDGPADIDLARSGTEAHDGLDYVALRDSAGAVAAWYRIQRSGQLRRMVRGPRVGQ